MGYIIDVEKAGFDFPFDVEVGLDDGAGGGLCGGRGTLMEAGLLS